MAVGRGRWRDDGAGEGRGKRVGLEVQLSLV